MGKGKPNPEIVKANYLVLRKFAPELVGNVPKPWKLDNGGGKPRHKRRNTGRRDGNALYEAFDDDGYDDDQHSVDEPEDTCVDAEVKKEVDRTPEANGHNEVSLYDLARPAKQKGVRKEFEVIARPQKVVELEDESQLGDDDWEDLEYELRGDDDGSRSSYAAILSHSPG